MVTESGVIHYHGGPITPNSAALEAWRGRHAMISFAAPDQIELAAEICQSFTLDNGAFTAWRAGKEVDWNCYHIWVSKWARHPGFDFAVIPDVIDGDEGANDSLLEWWLSATWTGPISKYYSVPVWHLHESIERLQRLCAEYLRVALGSSGQWATPGTDGWWKRMAEAMNVACNSDGYPLAKLHGLRMLDPTIFSHLPLASADSTNIARNIGIDSKWKGTYTPNSKAVRAMVLANRIEHHASAVRWNAETAGVQQNFELIG